MLTGASMVGILEAMEPGGFIEGEQLVPSLPLILEVSAPPCIYLYV